MNREYAALRQILKLRFLLILIGLFAFMDLLPVVDLIAHRAWDLRTIMAAAFSLFLSLAILRRQHWGFITVPFWVAVNVFAGPPPEIHDILDYIIVVLVYGSLGLGAYFSRQVWVAAFPYTSVTGPKRAEDGKLLLLKHAGAQP